MKREAEVMTIGEIAKIGQTRPSFANYFLPSERRDVPVVRSLERKTLIVRWLQGGGWGEVVDCGCRARRPFAESQFHKRTNN